MSAPLEIFVACLPGLEPFVARECGALGAAVGEQLTVGGGGVDCRGDFATLMRMNLGLGCASHVLLRVARFRARHFSELHKRADRVAWGEWLGDGAPFVVRASSRRSKLYHTGGIEERVTAAIARQRGGDGAVAGDPGAAVPVHARLVDDVCTLSIDTSGEPLHRGGFRVETAKAPLREDLAYALVLASEWDPDRPLVDPFCGAGTIPIVAARIARRLPPGLSRGYAFEALPAFDRDLWAAVQRDAEAQALERAPQVIVGSDRDAGAVDIARRNAERAGVAGDVAFHHAPLSACPGFEIGAERGAVVTNPPFGRRVGGDADRLAPLYQALGARVRELGPGWRCAVLAADRRLALRTGLRLSSAFLASHGGLRVNAMVG